MTSDQSIETQESITKWFDKTYSSHGEWYLRPRVAYDIFFALLGVQQGEKLLDVACGLGRVIETGIIQGVETSGIDISEVAVQKCQNKFPQADIRQGNAEQLPYAAATFDYITCLGSLERMLDRQKVLREMHRVLKEDGKVCLLVRNSESWFWKYVQRPLGFVNTKGHQDAKNLSEWKGLISSCDFDVVAAYKDQWPAMKWKRYFSLGMWNGYKTLQKGIVKLEHAYEFILICEKKR